MMSRPAPDEGTFTAVITTRVDGPSTQRAVAGLFLKGAEGWVRHRRGFLRATVHLSTDGGQVVLVADWRDEECYREFLATDEDRAALGREMRSLPGVQAGPDLVACHPYRTVAAAVSPS
ncbi:antibiotic biosynthesis monooxygenase [Streptomyces sp. NBC_00878]|uniref:antibiotic biosynthesis monooxygenase n=1 Tax=Streptomyces sp. NBC_00878 TaxID=2975854 RepID=UPI00224FC085|nr:antibiotic biosynthesis monooxygenase [Streptomyces sp. NBC_00878]MCX4906884.1 antibiotic biosynthesis monooxygenase [Streptomyces sp. NBC_00878]